MNLFRSEEHIHNWARFTRDSEQGIISLQKLLKLFGGDFFKKRLEPDYVSRSTGYVNQFLSDLAELGPFWSPAEEARAA
jgi:hypothetical protein